MEMLYSPQCRGVVSRHLPMQIFFYCNVTYHIQTDGALDESPIDMLHVLMM